MDDDQAYKLVDIIFAQADLTRFTFRPRPIDMFTEDDVETMRKSV